MATKKKKYERVTFTFEGHRYERYGKTKTEAHAKAATLKEQLKRGEVGVSSNMTVTAWANEWLTTYKEHSVGLKQYNSYKMYIDNYLSPALGTILVKNVKDVQLQKILNKHVGKSKSSLTQLRLTLKAIFKQAYISGLIQKNPAEYLTLPSGTEGKRRSITETERVAILAVAKTHRAGLWIKLMLYCGLRPGETRALRWKNIDFEKHIIHVEQSMKAGTRDVGSPKTEAGVRNVPIPDVFYDDLVTAKSEPFLPVIARETEGLLHTESSMRQMWRSFLRELDIHMGAKLERNKITIHAVADDLKPYCLRHTYCTDLEEKGVSINIAKYLMGHSDISTTAKIYTHTTDKAVQDAAILINTKKNISKSS